MYRTVVCWAMVLGVGPEQPCHVQALHHGDVTSDSPALLHSNARP
jgi:hypothetical protein